MRGLLIVLIVFSGCRHIDDLVTSYGPEVTASRHVGDFDKIVAGEKFDILLVQDSARAGDIEITAGKHVIEGYTTEVKDGELRIHNTNKFNWVRKLEIRQHVLVYFRDLNRIQINGSAKFSCRDTIIHKNTLEINHGGLEDAAFNIKGDYIYVNCSNTGGVILGGSCFLYSGTADDISFVDARNLKAKKSYFTSYSRRDSHVNGLEILEIRLFGVGNVFYNLQPSNSLKIEDEGEGEVIKE